MERFIGLVVAATLALTGCSGSSEGAGPPSAGRQVATSMPSAASLAPSPVDTPSPKSSVEPADTVASAPGWTIATLPGAPFKMAGERCGFANVIDMPARQAINAIDGTWELTGESTVGGFPTTARIQITITGGKPGLGVVAGEGEELEDGPMAFGTVDWTQTQKGNIDGVTLESTGGGVGKWSYFATGDVVFELKATKDVVVTVDGMEQAFPMQWPQWNLTNMTWKAQGCP